MSPNNFKDWRIRSKCQNLSPEQYDKLFFPSAGRSINEAKKFCSGCEVNTQCLEFALETEAQGIWAGTSDKERRGMLGFKNKITGVIPVRKKITRKNIVFT